MGRGCSALIVAVAATFAVPAAAAADTIVVNTTADSGAGSLREAISAAADGDTIEITATGTIGLESELPVIDDDVTIHGPGADLLTVTRASAAEFRIFGIPIAQVTISGLTITNGRTSDSGGTGPFALGGGILGFGADLTLREVVVSENHVSATGGSESAEASGGGIAVLGDLTVIDSTVTGNSLLATQSGLGGSASAVARGGGILFEGGPGTLRIEDSTIVGNSATASGTFISVGVAGIDSEGEGLLEGATVAGNSASAGTGAPFLAAIFADGQLGLRNAIVADTAGGSNCLTNAGEEQELDSRGHNLSDDASCTLDQLGDQVGVEPGLGPLALNGGPTPTMALSPASPALDAGIGTGADQRGAARPSDDIYLANAPAGNGADIGAFELQVQNPSCRGREGTIAAFPGSPTSGTPGADVVIGTPRRDRIFGRGGKDTICGRGKGDRLSGGPGRDVLLGGRGRDLLLGRGGRDLLLGGPGRDILLGGPGRDLLRGGPGRDRQKQ